MNSEQLRPLSPVSPDCAGAGWMTRCHRCGDHRSYSDCVRDGWKYDPSAGLAFEGYVCPACQNGPREAA